MIHSGGVGGSKLTYFLGENISHRTIWVQNSPEAQEVRLVHTATALDWLLEQQLFFEFYGGTNMIFHKSASKTSCLMLKLN